MYVVAVPDCLVSSGVQGGFVAVQVFELLAKSF